MRTVSALLLAVALAPAADESSLVFFARCSKRWQPTPDANRATLKSMENNRRQSMAILAAESRVRESGIPS